MSPGSAKHRSEDASLTLMGKAAFFGIFGINGSKVTK